MTKIIISTNKVKILVDEQNYNWLNNYNWSVNGVRDGYAIVKIDGKVVSMHRIILEKKLGRLLDKGEIADHINQNTLDNREENLRVADIGLSNHNVSKQLFCLSNHKGVSLFKDGRKNPWIASIYYKKERYTKCFKTEQEAANWYKEMAKKFYDR